MPPTPKLLVKNALRGLVRLTASPPPPLSADIWGLQRDDHGVLSLDGISLHDLGREYGFPVHVVNVRRLRANAHRFLAVPSGHAKGCEVFYSYKTNPVPGVLRHLHAAGLGAEVISPYELWLARQLGVPPERIVFNGPAKSEESIREAIASGMELLNVNHREELEIIERVARQTGRRPRVGLRITVGDGWAGQFGIPIGGGKALAAFAEAIRSPYLHVVGLHAHRGGMIRSAAELRPFVRAVLEFSDLLHERLGLAIEILNLGGSLGTPTVRPLSAATLTWSRTMRRQLTAPAVASALDIDRYIAMVVEQVEHFHAERRRPRPRIFVEPGRAVTSDAQMLLASVVNVKEESGRTYLILNAGINLAESCRSEYHQLLPVNKADRPRTRLYTIVGPICTPGDTLYWAAQMPPVGLGDSVAIMDAGAYFVPFSTAFSFPRPPIVAIDEGTVSVLRRGETFADLVACDALPPG